MFRCFARGKQVLKTHEVLAKWDLKKSGCNHLATSTKVDCLIAKNLSNTWTNPGPHHASQFALACAVNQAVMKSLPEGAVKSHPVTVNGETRHAWPLAEQVGFV